MNFASWFRGIKGKLLFAAVLPVIGFGVMGFISFNGANRLNALLESSHKNLIPNLQILAQMRLARANFGYHAFASVTTLQQPEIFADELKQTKDAIALFSDGYKDYEDSSFMPEEEKKFLSVKEYYPQLITTMENIVQLLETKDQQNIDKAHKMLLGEFYKLGLPIGSFNRETVALYNTRAKEESVSAEATQASVVQWTLVVTLTATFAIFGILLIIAARVSSSVSSVASRLSVAGGQVTSAVEQLNEAGNTLSQSSTEAAASLEETVASLEELSSMVQMNSDNAKQAAALSMTSREAAEKGQAEIGNLIQAMSTISSSSKKIEEIISVIDDIAFQTNLLALNASVEAARAGEQGKGFAVVAEAVRALAQRSAVAAKDVEVLIKQSVVQVEDGSRIANQSGEVLTTIVNSVKKVSDLNNEIATASSEQTAGIQQINKAMNQLDQAAQANAASAEEIAATSGEINNLAVTSQNLTAELSHVVNGGAQETTFTAPPAGKPSTTKHNVVSFKPKAKAKTASAKETIPFDEETRARVGTTDGF
ncbi:chemotaxis protein [Bdellovibrio bacteriovorus]|uniref:Chemotaxis protein n=1 Tax=Bdellovibrio bacteriovorus TaxID=959 RepID=A0A150WTZ7_BDEBC|nr:methyl-accepting chemotaxis protein [Bdellovibrio bacteriovorus]KYG69945.1 chemotaxis protein [Bdellovibrio bacteriovorus]